MKRELVIVIDFGGQYNQLVARRVRECNVYCEIYSYKTDLEKIKAMNPKGIILTGGPNSCYEADSPTYQKELFELGIPVLGLCYGAQLMMHVLGGKVEKADVSEYGKTELLIDKKDSRIFKNVSDKTICWMSHTDYISQTAPGFEIAAHTADCPVATAQNEEKKLYAIQFHPEVLHTVEGKTMLSNFVLGVCECAGDWKMDAFVEHTIKEIREKVGDGKVLLALSGGVDSSYVLAMSDAEQADGCGYEEERFDESVLAEKTAQLLGRKFSRSIITPEQFFDIVPYVMYNMEQPLGDASAIVFTLGCNATAEHTKICYSGEGSDEFFGGYNMYRNAERYGENLKNFYVGNTNIMKEDEKQKILKKYDPDVLPIELARGIYEETEGLDPLTKMSDVDIQIWLEGDIYLNVDKMSTAAGLEIRMPLTDRRIFDIASRMPSRYKVNEEQNKVAFRTAAAKVLPEEIAFRKKLGFIVPIRIWMADDRYNQDVRRLFNSEIAEKFFDVEAINEIFADYVGGNSDNWRKVWTIYTFLVWYEEYFIKR